MEPPRERGWAALLAKSLGPQVKLVNAGVSGTDSAAAVHRVQAQVLDAEPDLVITEFGVNDEWLDPAVRGSSYEALLRRLLAAKRPPAVVVLANALFNNAVLPARPSAASADTCKVTVRPGSRSPTDHSTVLPVTAPDVLAGSSTRPDGSVSLTTTSSATELPWFSTSTLKVTVPGTSPEPVGGEKI